MRTVVLTGFTGTGKSCVGRRLADRLGLPFIDTDERVAAAAGMPVGRILATQGEAYFQQLERRVLAEALQNGGAVVATGDGAILDPANEASMHRAGPVICLVADVEVILRRAREPALRPPFDPEAQRAAVARQLAERADAYGRADLCIDTSHRSVDATVEEILAYLRRHAAGADGP